jgi:hypothetical protein
MTEKLYTGNLKHNFFAKKLTFNLVTEKRVEIVQDNKNRRERHPCKRLWRPISVWVIEVPTISRHSAH